MTLNRPDRLNAIGDGMHEALEGFLHEVNTDEDVNAIVLAGAGRGFCAGGDVRGMADRSQAPSRRPLGRFQRGPKWLVQGFLNCEVPIIAAVNGPAAGLGATIALLCDVIYMADSATIGDTHVRVGVVAGDGGALIWPHLVGVHRAKEMLMAGRMLGAEEADRIGLVNHVVPANRLMEEATAYAAGLAAGPTLAIRWTKLAINKILWQSFNLVQEFSLAMEDITFDTEDHQEAVQAFVEKRAGRFVGR